MAEKDYYALLGVEKGASKEEIKKAYKRLAKRYHPDINKEDDASHKFKEINEAASVLLDDKKKEQYDQFGTADFSGFQGGMGGFDFGGMGDIFDQFFGGAFGGGSRRSRRRGPSRGSDLIYELTITLEEAAQGLKKEIRIPRLDRCSKCDGKGAENASDIVNCQKCDGNGQVRVSRRTPFGVFSSTSTCPDCRGQGQTFRKACPDCHGTGRMKTEQTVVVTIPAGIDNGNRLRLSGEGEAGERGAQSGDLYVEVFVTEHDKFVREGDSIFYEIPISFALAALGGEIEVPTLIDDDAKLKIPAGTQTGTVFRLKDLGMPRINYSGRGPQMIKVNIEVPTRLSAKQKEYLRQFEKENTSGGFFKKLFT
ncbi:molecular chaperone DnaJ [Candidatus Woesearchaeota archaeon CG11_big_fil_rev_8_21_14_0_20_43_8]|nr:MAG: molecular chaperone DnaJ [Candidatus Woesearchaeota archaeon CG11_big_fil_rev_8_21_14_0_20_43_8]